MLRHIRILPVLIVPLGLLEASPQTTMSISAHRHHRSLSRDSHGTSRPPRSPSPPTQTFHPSILPRSVPTPALVESVAGGAHYAGVRLDQDTVLKHRRSTSNRHHTQLTHNHERVLNDLTELYCCRATMEIFQRSWHPNAVFEVSLVINATVNLLILSTGPTYEM